MNEIQKALNRIREMARGHSSTGELASKRVELSGEELLDIANVLNKLEAFLKSPLPGDRDKSVDEIMDSELRMELHTLVKVIVPKLIDRLKG